ncbi:MULTISPECIES: DUF2939 domain-containing protein [unclassified Duganella]|jgi:hypothetical protein|uniref:DUF2939 domain-containing protein n=1 Tax=unclassified Duganella TaxID=2636909 RepID=UPI000883540E|nr:MULTISPECIES: DUF2939 domain-containing protein [unclassified Duganella]SDG91965.1 Protein of unknown function [Duganella sp. OV458]SDJ50450.1 Protein of unknown function [Duganella sp. OV510]
MNRNRLYVALILSAVAGYWYFSPYLTVYQLQAAAQAGDAAAFNKHVDYPQLRDSVKQQLVAMTTGPSASEDSLAAKLGQLVIDKLVNAFVRPEAVMLAMQKGVFKPQQKHAGVPDQTAAQKPQWTSSHDGVNRFIVQASDAKGGASQTLALVLERNGFADWKLAEIRLPADVRQP